MLTDEGGRRGGGDADPARRRMSLRGQGPGRTDPQLSAGEGPCARDVEELAAQTGGKPQTLRKHRRKAESVLAAAVAPRIPASTPRAAARSFRAS